MSEQGLFDLAALRKIGGIAAGDLLAVDPELYKKFAVYQTRTVKHDPITRNLVFLTGLSAYTPEPINVFLRGESSIGKTYITVNVLGLFPKEDVWFLGGLSPTALVHDRGLLVDKDGEPILHVDRPEKDATEEEKQAYQDYRERMKDARYLVDMRGKILLFLEAPNLETFNKLRPILSHDCYEISYKFTDKQKGQPLQTMHVIIRGWPACVFCSTSERFVQDLATRSFTDTPKSGESKIKQANRLTGAKAALPWKFDHDKDAMLLEGYIRFFKDKMEELKVIVPCADKFAETFPCKFPRSMRDFKHLLGLIQVRALFHFAQRPVLIRKVKVETGQEDPDLPKYEEKEETYILAVKDDYDAILVLWKEIRETTETSAGAHIITFFKDIVQKAVKGKLDQTVTIQDLTDRWNDDKPDRKSSDTIRNWVDFLCEIGYMTKEPNPKDKRENFLKVIKNEEKENGNYTQNDLSAFFTLENFKAWLNTARQITEESQVILRKNILSNTEVTSEELFSKNTLSDVLDSSVIYQGNLRDAFPETSHEKADNEKTVQYPNLQKAEL
jgi:hypothetical protein